MAQQTALSWYIEQHKILSSKTGGMPISEIVVKIKDIEIQAKEMEKQQIEDAVNYGDQRGKIATYRTAEQYYTQTYGNNTKNE